MKISFSRPRTLALAALTMLAALSGCAADDSDVKPHVEVIDRTKSALSASGITAVNGTYGAACSGRAAEGTDAWTVDIAVPSASTLSVRKNDSDCVLTITSVLTADGTFIGSPSIALGTAYNADASAFATDNGPLAFYANAKISSLAFADDFTVSLLVSDDPRATDSGDRSANFATQSASVESNAVPASSYTISYASFDVVKDVDDVVQSVSGFAQLSSGAVAGQDYAIHEGWLDGSSSFAAVDAAFAGATSRGSLAALDALKVPAADFGLVGLDLDSSPKRTVIVRNTSDGVSSYQLLSVTFTP